MRGFRVAGPIAAIAMSLAVCIAGSAAAQPPSVPGGLIVTPKGTLAKVKDKGNSGLDFVVQVKLMAYKAPTSDRAPHSMTVSDGKDSVKVVAWSDTWSKIPFAAKLAGPEGVNSVYTMRLTAGYYRDEPQGRINRGEDIAEGEVELPPAPPMDRGGSPAPAPAIEVAPIEWASEINPSLVKAAAEKKDILVFFAAPEAENSRFLETTIFADSRVRQVVRSQYVAVRLDMATQAELAKKLGVFRGGSVNIYRPPGGSLVKQITSVRRVEDFLPQIR